jgi:hypothetical protein
MHRRELRTAYYQELFGALALYIVLLVAALRYGPALPPGPWRVLVMLSPMLGFVLALLAIVRMFRRLDEYMRRVQLENIALAAGLTAGLSFSYGFLEITGQPRLSMFSVWMVLCGSWGLISALRAWRFAGRT